MSRRPPLNQDSPPRSNPLSPPSPCSGRTTTLNTKEKEAILFPDLQLSERKSPSRTQNATIGNNAWHRPCLTAALTLPKSTSDSSQSSLPSSPKCKQTTPSDFPLSKTSSNSKKTHTKTPNFCWKTWPTKSKSSRATEKTSKSNQYFPPSPLSPEDRELDRTLSPAPAQSHQKPQGLPLSPPPAPTAPQSSGAQGAGKKKKKPPPLAKPAPAPTAPTNSKAPIKKGLSLR